MQRALKTALREMRGSFVRRISVRGIDGRVARSFAYKAAGIGKPALALVLA
jgi:hypothetical protein